MNRKGEGRTHGLRGTYNAGCRCPECSWAQLTYSRKYARGEHLTKTEWDAKVKSDRSWATYKVPAVPGEAFTRAEIMAARG